MSGNGTSTKRRQHPEPQKGSSWWGRLTPGDALAALVLAGLVVYVSIAQSYSDFYSKLGVTPDQVGLGYQQIVERSALGFGFAIAVFIWVGFIALGFLVWLEQFAESHANFTKRLPFTPRGFVRRNGVYVFLLVVVVLARLAFSSLGGEVNAQAGAVQRGVGVQDIGVFGQTVVVLRVHPVKVVWVGSSPPVGLEPCMMDLGEKDGVEALYDVQGHKAVRVPATSIVMISTETISKAVC